MCSLYVQFFLFHFPSYNQDEDEVNALKVPEPKDHPSSSTPSFSGMPNQKAAWNTKFTEKCEK